MVFRREGQRVYADFMPEVRHQGFPGVLHGGVIATLLDETMGRTGALQREWLVTGKLDIRYRQPAPLGQPIRVWGEVARKRRGAIDAIGAVELRDGTVVADARGLFLELPERVAAEAMERYPEFVNYWE
jgi:acyl-coenzyme A thioesterase PaaI-like protein